MPGRQSLVLVLFASTACGDSGGGTSDATNVTGVSASASASASSSSGEPTPTTGEPEQPTTGGPSSATSTSEPADPTTSTTSPTTATTTADPSATDAASETADDTTSTTGQTTDPGTGGAVCGDGIVDASETCDDGQGVGCDTYHDGGAGTCVPPGECSAGFILAGDVCVAELATDHVHIMVDNQCKMTVMPAEFTVPAGQKLRLDYHNHSQDYAVDVWMHYNGGFTDLAPGATWSEKYEHCFGPAPSEGYAEISTACSDFVLPIHCL